MSFINVQYCYTYLVDQIPVGLLLYSHIPTALISLFFGSYLLFKSRKILNVTLFFVCLFFSLWCFFDLISWFAYLGSPYVMFSWSLVDLISLLFFFFSYYFIYSFITKEDLPVLHKVMGVITLLPTLVWTFLGLNLQSYDANACASIENENYTTYYFYVGAIYIVLISIFVIYKYIKNKSERKQIFLAGGGITLFLLFFYTSTLLVSIFTSGDSSLYVYNFELYGLFGMPVLLIFLGYLIVEFKAFNVRLFGAQALVITLITLIASKIFTDTGSSQKVTILTLLAVCIFGYYLIKSVKKEIETREKIEKLADKLEQASHALDAANKGQKNLIHVMNHQIKGYLGVMRNIFAELQTDDYGVMPEPSKPLLAKGLESTAKAVDYVQSVLVGSSASDGTLRFNMKPVDIKTIGASIFNLQKEIAEKAGLSFEVNIEDGDCGTVGDATQLGEVFKNLITNAIKYNSPQGKVSIELARKSDKIMFSVKDTGIGISEEDKPILFTSGGRGKDSIKYNSDSSGFGLAFVKGVAEAHRGKVFYKPNSPEAGTTFFVELPIIKESDIPQIATPNPVGV